MKTGPLYWVGTTLLFIGLFWMFLPHTAHQTLQGNKQETEHYVHLIQGLIGALLGLGILFYEKRRT
jgi:drug/metabolite transporter (DMT)-like permease